MKKLSRTLLSLGLLGTSLWVSPNAQAGIISQTSGTGAHANITAGQTFTMPSNENGTLTSITVAGLYFRSGSVSYVGCIGAKVYTSIAKTTQIDASTNTICDTNGGGDFVGAAGSGTFTFGGAVLAAGVQYYFEYYITSGSSGGGAFYVNEYSPSQYAGGSARWGDNAFGDYDLQFTLTYAALSNCSVVTTTSAGYGYVAIKGAGSRCAWTTPAGVSAADFLVVGGGGGGGSRHNGGGGAGGLLKPTSVSLANVSSLAIYVGNGGAGGSGGGAGTNGETSTVVKLGGSGSFSSLSAVGGGAGAGSGITGGSGGGSYSGVTYATNATGTAGTADQGSAGGRGGYSASAWSAGGGGGAATAGSDATASAGGDGGAGTTWLAEFTSSIATSLTLTDTSTVFAGGGGGGIALASGDANGGAGGSGGGGAGGGTAAGSGRAGATGVSGAANTGGGGGGSGFQQGAGNVNGGSGGSGLILIRYVIPTVSVTAPTYSGTINKGTLESITVTVNMVGKVRFFFDGKKIPGCLAVPTSGSTPNYTATCTWKPAVTGSHIIHAVFTPTDVAFTAQRTTSVTLAVLRRTNTR